MFDICFVNIVTCVVDRRDFRGSWEGSGINQRASLTGFRIIVWSFFRICFGRSKIDPGVIWDHFLTYLEFSGQALVCNYRQLLGQSASQLCQLANLARPRFQARKLSARTRFGGTLGQTSLPTLPARDPCLQDSRTASFQEGHKVRATISVTSTTQVAQPANPAS